MTSRSKYPNIFDLTSFCVVTGASKGLGQCIARRLAAKLPPTSAVVLMARSAEGLLETKTCIERDSPGIRVAPVPVDLSMQDSKSLLQLLDNALQSLGVKASAFEQALVVHNAASLGDISKLFTQHQDFQELQTFWNLNLTAPTLLNSVFLQLVAEASIKQRVVINISSICSLQPFKSWSLYCAGKAARDMLFRTMALEEPSIRVLNYAPGPIDTDMQVSARTLSGDIELRDMFREFHVEGKLLSVDQSIDKLIPLLEKNAFDSGAHIDYYDI